MNTKTIFLYAFIFASILIVVPQVNCIFGPGRTPPPTTTKPTTKPYGEDAVRKIYRDYDIEVWLFLCVTKLYIKLFQMT